MLEGALLTAVGLTLVFAFVILFGAPYLPTLSKQAHTALELLDLKNGQVLLELGAGDGSVALLALRRGLKVTAIELNPLLCVVIWLRTWRYRREITIKCANFWTTDWGRYDGIYVFLLDKFMKRLDKKIIQTRQTIPLASYTFTIPGKKADDNRDGVYLYRYKAK
jgi:hypothetical protein